MALKFRKDITHEFENKLKEIVQKNDKPTQLNEDLIELDIDPASSLENKVRKLIDMLIHSRELGRALKSAYLEEELYSLG